jgi:hypothetical protein
MNSYLSTSELYNNGNTTIDISEWTFTRGITFTFPSDTKIEPDSFIVLCKSVESMKVSSCA